LQTLSWLFEANGYQCRTARNTREALNLFDSTIDLVVLDHALANENGAALAAQIKQIRDVPILMLSGLANLKKPDGIDVLLLKPQEPQELLATALSLIVRSQTAGS
jgi:DNA-binding response OmpR family regulator